VVVEISLYDVYATNGWAVVGSPSGNEDVTVIVLFTLGVTLIANSFVGLKPAESNN